MRIVIVFVLLVCSAAEAYAGWRFNRLKDPMTDEVKGTLAIFGLGQRYSLIFSCKPKRPISLFISAVPDYALPVVNKIASAKLRIDQSSPFDVVGVGFLKGGEYHISVDDASHAFDKFKASPIQVIAVQIGSSVGQISVDKGDADLKEFVTFCAARPI